MTTNRRVISRPRKARVTPEALEVYRRAREIYDTPNAAEEWEEDGGRRREYLNARGDLQSLLGLKPWEASVLSTIGSDDAPAGLKGTAYAASWPQVVAIRRELERLCEQ